MAQTSSAQLSGFVTDTTGSRVPGARVTLTDTNTQVARDVISNAAAEYTFSSILPGTYQVTASKAGFDTVQENGIVLNVGDVRALALTLKVGTVSEKVTVNADAQIVNTANSEVAQTIDERQVEELPLNGRSFEQLVTLSDGAYSTTGGSSSQFRPQLGNSDLGFGGGRYNSVGYMIDGMVNRDVAFGAPILLPSIDALKEFKALTGTYSAQYGGSAQQVNINIKSGTNTFHGTVYDFVRNEAFNALTYNTGTTRPELRWNQFGYSLGGPVWIPKIYNGRNKTFFFANYEGLRQTQNSVGVITVPDPTELGGVFPETIIDPLTGQPFPNNTIPSDRIVGFAKTYNKFFQAPNGNFNGGNYQGTVANPINSNQQNYRIDENLNDKNSMFFRYSWSQYAGTTGGVVSTGDSGVVIYNADVDAYQGGWTHTFSPTMVNEFRVGYLHTRNDSSAPTIDQADWAALGIKGAYTDITAFELPNVIFNGNGVAGGGTNINYPTVDRTWYWDASDSIVITRGRHVISTGLDSRIWKHTIGKGANLGQYTFNGEVTGDPVADYLLGYAYNVTLPQPTPLAPSASQLAFNFPQFTIGAFGEDEYKATPRLTVNAGLRYDFYSITREQSGAWAWLDPTVPGGGLCVGTTKLAQLGISNDLEHYCGRNTPNPAPKLVFAPRVSLAYAATADGKTAIRAGYGIFFDTPEENDDVNIANIYPFFQNGSYTSDPGSNYLINVANPFPVVTTLQPVTAAQLGFVFAAPDKQATYSSQWSLGLERELPKGYRVTASYLGSHTVHLQTRVNAGQAYYYDPNNPLSVTARLPYPTFGPSFYSQNYAPNASYNAGTVKVEKQAADLQLLTSFTWSRSMDIRSGAFGVGNDGNVGGWAGPSDTYDLQRDYGRSSFDINKRFVASFVYELPVGHGKRLLPTLPRAADTLIGGWQVNGIGTIQSGLPFSIAATDVNGLIDTQGQRANLLHNPLPSGFSQTRNQWFDVTAFSQPAQGLFGTSGRNILLAPLTDTWDLSLVKNFRITEQLRFQLRGEAFNALNRANLAAPVDSLGATNLGQIGGALLPARVVQVAGKFIW